MQIMINSMYKFLNLIKFSLILFLMAIIYVIYVMHVRKVHKLDYFICIIIFYKSSMQTHLNVMDLNKLFLLQESLRQYVGIYKFL